MLRAGLEQCPALAGLAARREKLGLHGLPAEAAAGLRRHIRQRGSHRSASTRQLAAGLGLGRKAVHTELLGFGEIGCRCGGHYLGGRSYPQQVVEHKGQLASHQELLLRGPHYEWRKLKLLGLRSAQSVAPKDRKNV